MSLHLEFAERMNFVKRQEHFTKPTLTTWVVLEIEFVKSMEIMCSCQHAHIADPH